MVQPLQEFNRNTTSAAQGRKVRFEPAPLPSAQGGVQEQMHQQIERLKQEFNRKVAGLQQHLDSEVYRLQEEIHQVASATARPEEASISNVSNEEGNRDSRVEHGEPAADSVPYEASEWAREVAEKYGPLFANHPGSPASPERDEHSPTTPSSSGESAVSDASSPQVTWTLATSPASCGHRVRATLPAIPLAGLERRLPQAPMHEPPKGPMRAVSANLPEDCGGSGLARTGSRPLLTVDGPRSARQSRPSLAVPQGSSSARVRVETRESRGTVGSLASPRRVARVHTGHAGYPVQAFSRTVWPVRAPVFAPGRAPARR